VVVIGVDLIVLIFHVLHVIPQTLGIVIQSQIVQILEEIGVNLLEIQKDGVIRINVQLVLHLNLGIVIQNQIVLVLEEIGVKLLEGEHFIVLLHPVLIMNVVILKHGIVILKKNVKVQGHFGVVIIVKAIHVQHVPKISIGIVILQVSVLVLVKNGASHHQLVLVVRPQVIAEIHVQDVIQRILGIVIQRILVKKQMENGAEHIVLIVVHHVRNLNLGIVNQRILARVLELNGVVQH
jgi:hypothetical protein